MEEKPQVTLKSLLAISVIGYVFYILINSIERILSSICKIIGCLTNIKANLLFFSDIISQVIIIAFWIVLIFWYLKRFSGKIDLYNIEVNKNAFKIGFVAIFLIILSFALNYLESLALEFYRGKLDWNYNQKAQNFMIISLIYISKIIIVIIGFFKILRTKKILHS